MDFTNYKIKKIKNKTFYQGRPLTILDISRKDKKKIKRNELLKICFELRDDLRDVYTDGLISVSILYPERWYSGSISRLSNDNLNIFSMDQYDEFDEDPNEYKQFRFMFVPLGDAKGGQDKNNDCLMNCIKKCVQRGAAKLNAAELKNILGLERNDMIDIDKLPEVEKYINRQLGCKVGNQFSINVIGDYEYKSKIESNKVIRLTLSNNHYSLNSDEIKTQNTNFKEKPIMMFDTEDNEQYFIYDGETTQTITKDVFNKYKSFDSKYIMVKKQYCRKVKDLSIEDSYASFIDMADKLKEETKGRINLYRSGGFKQAALKYFFEINTAVQPDEIDDDNAKWINEATHAALTYWQPYHGNIHSYDINSHYPNVMRKNFNYFPVKDGEFKILSKDEFKKIIQEPTPDYGIYRCIITKPDIKPYKFFRTNKNNKYTHLDLACAVAYGLKIELVEDGQPNFLYFSRDKLMDGAFLFNKYVDELYELKMKGIQGAKEILNILWGALCETRIYKQSVDYDEEVNIENCELNHLHAGDNLYVEYMNYSNKKIFKTNFGRMKPFLIAYGRHSMMKIFSKYEHLVIRMHTDGFYLKEQPSDILTGPKIGNLKYEGQYRVTIEGINKMTKEKIG